MTRYDVMEALRYRGPLLNAEGVVVERFTVPTGSIENVILSFQPGGRGTRPGEYTRLDVDGRLWMSDTDAERRDHAEPALQASWALGGRGLVNGLGLGLVVGAMLDNLAHVDVVEADERVARLIGAWYSEQFGDRVTIHVGDAYEMQWPKGTRWDVVWHDVWPTLCEDNLDEMATLHRKYGGRAEWQGSWGKMLLRQVRDRRNSWALR